MIYSISGSLSRRGNNFVVVNNAGFGFKIFVSKRIIENLSSLGSKVKFFCHFQVRDDAMELYGFLTERELDVFGFLNSVSGVGPKSAISIMNEINSEDLEAAISSNRPDVLAKVSGIGKKTAERIVLELRDKISSKDSGKLIEQIEKDADITDALVNLGYSRGQAKEAVFRVSKKTLNFQDRLKEALKIAGGNKR